MKKLLMKRIPIPTPYNPLEMLVLDESVAVTHLVSYDGVEEIVLEDGLTPE
jgi:hypothetical protein